MLTVAMIKPDGREHLGEILEVITRSFAVEAVRVLRLAREEAALLYADHAGKDWFGAHLDHVTSGPVVVLLLSSSIDVSPHAALRKLIGPTDPRAARREAPESIRARFGTGMPQNAIHAPADEREAARDVEFFQSALRERGDYL